MKVQSMLGLARPLALILIVLGVLMLGAQPQAWATPEQRPAGQTVPTFTPTNSPTPGNFPETTTPTASSTPTTTSTPTASPVSNNTSTPTASPAATNSPTATPRGNRKPTATPKTSATATATPIVINTGGGQPGPIPTAPGAPSTGGQPGAPGNAGGQASAPGNAGILPSFPCTIRPADPGPATPRVLRQPVDSTTAITLLNCPWSVAIAAGDLGFAGTLEMKLINAGASQAANAGERFFGPHIELTFFDASGQPIARPTFARPISLCFNYSADDLAVLNDPAAFTIEFFNPSTRQWERLQSTLDGANSRVCTALPHLSLYALAARVPVPSALPRTGAAGDPNVATWIWGLLALGLGLGVSIWTRRSQRAQPVEVPKE